MKLLLVHVQLLENKTMPKYNLIGVMFKRTYHTKMMHLKSKLWYLWHCTLCKFFGGYTEENRPFYHICCNGNAGGWRTNLCDSLEDYSTGWRYHESKLEETK